MRLKGFFDWLLGAPKEAEPTRLTAEAAVVLAAGSPEVQTLGWDLSVARLHRDGDRLLWRVMTNHIGAQWWVDIDDATGAVSAVHHAPGR
jgi:hypothetical protein